MAHRSYSGFSLVETLLSMLVVALAALALGGFAGELRVAIDLSRQRAAASRAAQGELESARAFTQLHAGAARWSAIGEEPSTANWTDGFTNYLTQRSVDQRAGVALKQLERRVSWSDRRGHEQSLVMRSAAGAIDPAWSTALGLPPAGARSGDPMGRSALLPLDLIALNAGRGAWVPFGASGLYYVVELSSARVVARCTGNQPLPGDGGCANNLDARLLGGHVAFHASGPARIEGARTPSGTSRPLAGIHFAGQTMAGATPAAQCFDDSPAAAAAGRSYIAYTCVVTLVDGDANPETPPSWSGRTTVLADASWTIGSGLGQSKVCRYSVQREGSTNDNVGHPLQYSNVAITLMNQNFLVIDATASVGGQMLDNACPSESPPPPTSQADSSTLLHQPVGVP